MDGLVFIVVIVLFSLLEGVLRKQKAAQRARLHEQAPEDGEHGPTQDGQFEDARYGPTDEGQFDATYGSRSSYDDDHDILEYSNQYTAASPSAPTPPEPLIPEDVWEELTALVSGAQPGAHVPEQPALPPPRAETAAVTRTETGVARRRGSRRPATEPEHIVHRAHAGYGTDPSSRAPSEQDRLDPLAEHLGADVGAVHQLFSSRNPLALRQAIILQEVLGLPAALRGDPYDP
jgi:hypothetical protein